MPTILEHACKFCHRPVTLKINDGADQFFSLEYWKSLAACNSCADFHDRRLKLKDRIIHHVLRSRKNNTKEEGEEEPDPMRIKPELDKAWHDRIVHVRERLTHWTKCYATRLYRRERRATWEPAFVDMLLLDYKKCDFILDKYFADFCPNTYAQWMAAKEKDAKMRAPSGDSSGTSRR